MPLRIVLADDHPIVLGGLHQLLSLERDLAVVARCTNGTDALSAVRRERPDILIADLTMPGLTGLELLREIQSAVLPAKVILLTARIEHEQVLEAMRLGAAGIVLKESAPLQILDCIRRVATGERWIDEALGQRRPPTDDRLTAREHDVVRMVAEGLSNREIAERLDITEGTVKTHLRAVFEKLGVSSRMKLSVYAREHGLG